ncbi:MAG: 3-deoxy-manno-octulosonate cytidylyltransferase [Bacteroidetes bacterium]|nr:MAG: 3-deoxy-manno-octulosonate cytidylyltransferase [Bacteroidota bacterium]
MKIIGIIPARYQSSRFPGKPLADIKGKTMIQRVYEQALLCPDLSEVIVATDDNRILNHVKEFGGKVVMTSPHHQSGTERCAEVLNQVSCDAVINIQGDEPFIDPSQITQVAQLLKNGNSIATLIKKIDDLTILNNPNIPKVVIDKTGKALYFSRATIPYVRDHKAALNTHVFYKHIGIYGYLSKTLKEIVKLKPSPLEIAERLEQLRWLENGFSIQTSETQIETFGIDVPEDLKKIR